MAELYPWIKALHVFFVISWMAGMLYLPRLFVYHSQTTPGTPEYERFGVMERRLMRGIMLPSAVLTWVFGIAMLWLTDWAFFAEGWLHVKLTGVVILTVLHHMCIRWRRGFAEGRNPHSERFYRIVNEVPAPLLLVILVMVIVRPF
jgi:putative membrane protein